MLDQDDMVNGRVLREGEVMGKVGNFDRRENGTTYHLHFDVQVPTRDGWMYINPYSMLVTAYERLIGGRGAEIKEEVVASAPADATQSEVRLDGSPSAGPVNRQASITPVAIKPEAETNHTRRARIGHRGVKAHASAHLHTHCFRRCGRI